MLGNIKEIHIEPTSVCNAECPMCARNINGKGLNPYVTLKSLPVKWFEDNINPDQIKKLDKIFFCGNVGDPASAPELLGIISFSYNEETNSGTLMMSMPTSGETCLLAYGLNWTFFNETLLGNKQILDEDNESKQ